MISLVMFLLVVGLVAFGPKKTIEMAQACGRAVSQIKEAARASHSQPQPDENE